MEIIYERLSCICISRGLRDYLREKKKEKTYDQFLRDLIKNTENLPTDSQVRHTHSTKKGDASF